MDELLIRLMMTSLIISLEFGAIYWLIQVWK